MVKQLFVTATDTDAGKTLVAEIILQAAKKLGLSSVAMKPISAGCELNEHGELRNSDALRLQRMASHKLPYAEVNPYAYAPPIAPHIAAEQAALMAAAKGETMMTPTVAGVQQAYERLLRLQPDILLCEGAGGWQLPINEREYLSDFVARQQIPVVLVVPMRLGCLNHALLSAQAIRAQGLVLAGWFANQLSPEPMPYYHENVASLEARLEAPLVAEVPFFANSSAITEPAEHQRWVMAQLQQPSSGLQQLLMSTVTNSEI